MTQPFIIRQLGEIEVNGPDGPDKINGLILEGDAEAIRESGLLFLQSVRIVPDDQAGRRTAQSGVKVKGLLDEGLEILNSLIDNVKRHGNYSPESTCMFIDQAGACLREALRTVAPAEAATASMERLGSDFEAVWDKNTSKLYEFDDAPAEPDVEGDAKPVAWQIGEDGALYATKEAADKHVAGWAKKGVKVDSPRPLYTHPSLLEECTQATTDVLAERRRQVEAEGWTPEHDDRHSDGALAQAAACYAVSFLPYVLDGTGPTLPDWPWDAAWWKPSGRRRDLVKAGALILAEIERLDRLTKLEAGR